MRRKYRRNCFCYCLQNRLCDLLLGQGKVEPFLLKAMDPPSPSAVEKSIQLLITLRAFDHDENLTPLGFHLANLPMDPFTGKMVLMAALFSCIDPILTIAACLSFKDPFLVPLIVVNDTFDQLQHKEKEVDKVRHRLSKNTMSDHMMFYHAVKGWEDAKRTGSDSRYCWDHFMSANTLHMVSKMKQQFAELLHSTKFIGSPSVKDPAANRNSGNTALVRAILCAGLYPNVAKIRRAGRKHCKYSTQTEGKIEMHLKSVNANDYLLDYGQWVMFYEVIKLEKKVCMLDSTLMPAYPIMFFGGDLEQKIEGGEQVEKYEAVVVDEWIVFKCKWQIADLVKQLRQQLDEVLQAKITKPGVTDWDRTHKEGAIMNSIVELITKEQVRLKTTTRYP